MNALAEKKGPAQNEGPREDTGHSEHRNHRPPVNNGLPQSPGSREMPWSEEAEQHVIACCLLDGSDTIARCMESRVGAECFFSAANRLIFEVIVDLYQKSPPVTLEMLAEELKTRRHLEAIGGFPYLMQITGKIPTTAHAGYFIERVRETHLLRGLIKAATGAVEQCYRFTTGDIEEFANSIKQNLTDHANDVTVSARSRLHAQLDACRVFTDRPPPKPDARFYLANKAVATPGNLMTVIARAKAGKTASVGAMVASAVSAAAAGIRDVDTLGFKASNPEGRALVVFDTEQSEADAHACVMRALQRTGKEGQPEWLRTYSVAGWAPPELRLAIQAEVRRAARECGGIFAVVIDGVADLVNDVNQAEESNSVVTELVTIARSFNTPVIAVIHSNEARSAGDDARGHLGKQLTRKAESNLLLEKIGGVTTITSEKQRGAPITDADAIAFAWSESEGRHVTCPPPARAKSAAKNEAAFKKLKALAATCFAGQSQLRRCELERLIEKVGEGTGNTLVRRVDKMLSMGVVRKNEAGAYEIIT